MFDEDVWRLIFTRRANLGKEGPKIRPVWILTKVEQPPRNNIAIADQRYVRNSMFSVFAITGSSSNLIEAQRQTESSSGILRLHNCHDNSITISALAASYRVSETILCDVKSNRLPVDLFAKWYDTWRYRANFKCRVKHTHTHVHTFEFHLVSFYDYII